MRKSFAQRFFAFVLNWQREKPLSPLFRFCIAVFLLFCSYSSLAQWPPLAPVNPPNGGFKIDGTLKANNINGVAASGQGDWVFGTTGSGDSVFKYNGNLQYPDYLAHPELNARLIRDTFNHSSDPIFSGSGFSGNPNTYVDAQGRTQAGWKWTTGKPTSKCDISTGMYLITTSANSKWIVLGGDRLTTVGTSYIDFEFLQETLVRNNDNTFSSEASNLTGGRTEGDFVLSMEYSNGGTTATVHYYRWEEEVPGGGSYKYVEHPVPYDAFGDSTAFGKTNGAATDVPFRAFGGTSYIPFAFVEAAVNIDAIISANCESLSIKTIFIKTKASDSYSAALKDFLEPQQVNFTVGSTSIEYDGPFCNEGTASPSQAPSITGGTYTSTAGLDIDEATGEIDLANSTAGTYTVTYIYDGGGGCDQPATTQVVINAKPAAPTVGVVNNCNNTSTLTVTGLAVGATVNWTDDATNHDNPRTVSTAGTYYATQTLTGCTSPSSDGATAAPKTTPGKPTVGVVNNCDGTSTLTVTGLVAGATVNWVDAPTNHDNPRTVNIAGTYSATQTANECTSAPSDGTTAAPKTTPGKPTVGVVNNCNGTSTLTVTGLVAGATVNWLDAPTNHDNPRTVNSAGTYTSTQTADGCTSPPSDGTVAAPKTTPGKPTVGVVNNCDGTSTLTVTGLVAGATVNWVDAPTNHDNPRTVYSGGTYSATQTADGCTSPPSDGTVAAPKTTPGKPTVGVVNNCDGSSTLTVTGLVSGATVNWVDAPTNHDNPRTVYTGGTYSATQTANGCTGPASDGTIAAPSNNPDAPEFCIVEPSLCGPATGSVTILSPLGTGFEYSIDNGTTWTANTVFTDVAAGSVTGIKVKNGNDCISGAANCGSSDCSEQKTAIQNDQTGTVNKYTVSSLPAATEKPELIAETSVKAFPNPFKEQVRFVINTPTAVTGSLDIFNLMGQKIKSVYQGMIPAGTRTFDLTLPGQQFSTLIYVFRTGDEQITGKLLQVGDARTNEP